MDTMTFRNDTLQEALQFVTHKSGLRVYVLPKKGFHKYYAIYGTEYGSLNRTFLVPGDREMTTVPDGIAHYLEHKMFEEEDGGNAFDRFALTGASSNAFTSFDLTAYLFSCTDRFYDNLDILMDFVNHPWFTQENVAKEQGIIGQEIKMYEDDPEWRVFFNTLTALYQKNPVKIDIAGTVESISHITPEILYRCYNTFYNPANMILVVVGDVEMEQVLAYVDKHVDASRNLGKIRRETVREPKERVQEKVNQKLVVSQPMFRIGFKDNQEGMEGEALLKKEIATELILEAVLGRSSNLYMQLYEEGLIDSSFGCEADIEKAYGFTLIGGESKDPEQVYTRIKAALDMAVREGLAREDVERAKKVLISGNIRMYNSPERIGNDCIRRLMNGINPLEYGRTVEAVTPQEIAERLREHFDTSNCVLSVVEPTA